MTEQFYTVVFDDGNERLFPGSFSVGGLPIFSNTISIRKVVESEGAEKMLKEVKKAIKFANEKTHVKSRVVVYYDNEYTEFNNEEKFFVISNYKIIPINISY